MGLEILDEARDERVRAFGYGYLAHLAADAVAHNYFVPHQLAVTSSTSALGHSYWESRFETHIGDTFPRRAHEIILLDHARSDEHLDRILSPTIFSTPTNRRIFRGMVYVTDTESWQRIFAVMAENSRWDLDESEVGRYLTRSFDFVMDFLVREASSEPYALDPRATARCGRRSSCDARRCAAAGTTRSAATPSGSSAFPAATWRSRGRSRGRSTCRPSRARADSTFLGSAPPLGLLHHETDEHALQLVLAAGEPRRLRRVLGPDLLDPRDERRVVAHLEEPVAMRDRGGGPSITTHRGEHGLRGRVAERTALHERDEPAERLRRDGERARCRRRSRSARRAPLPSPSSPRPLRRRAAAATRSK